METIRGSMEMAQCIILRTLPLLGSPGIEQKPLISPVILFQRSLSCTVCVPLHMCVPNFQTLTASLIYLCFFSSPTSSFSFPPCPQARQTAPKALEFVWVCMRASVNPFCQALAQPFLSKLPAWSRSPLCWWEELEEKACGTPAAPRPSPGPSAHEGRAWDLLRAGALCGSCDWRFNRLSLGHPSATLHSLSHLGNGGKRQLHTYSATALSQSFHNPASLMYGHLPEL